VVHDEDGGVRETMESIVIPPMAHAPFTTMLQSEWVRTLYTGGTITLVNERRIARDSSGRVYQERWLLVPKNGKVQSRMSPVQISDPVKHTLATCMMDDRKVCDITLYTPSNTTVFKFEGPQTGPLPNDAGFATHEDLGTQTIAGLDTKGTRDSTIYNPGFFGNDEKVTVEREYWYSEQLSLNLVSKRSDRAMGRRRLRSAISPWANRMRSCSSCPRDSSLWIIGRRRYGSGRKASAGRGRPQTPDVRFIRIVE